MSSEWNNVRLGDISEVITKGTTPTSVGYSFRESGINYVKSESITFDGCIDVSKFAFIDAKAHASLKRSQLKEGDILFSMAGVYIGKTAVVPKRILPANTNQAVGIVRIKQDKALPRFIDYHLRNPSYNRFLNNLVSQSAQPNLNLAEIRNLPITLPSLQEQKSIAETLGALDDRITLLRETNATLEAIAQALFKSWFVDFDPVHAKQQGRAPEGMDEATAVLFPDSFEESELGLVPRGWRACTMDDVSTVGIGKTPPRKEAHWFSESSNDVRWVSIRDMGISGSFISQTSEYLTAESIERFNVRQVPDNTALLSFKMTIGRVALTDGEMTTNEAIAHFKLDAQSPLTSEFIYLHLKQFDYSRLSSTSSIADAVNSKTVKGIPILVPDAGVLKAFQESICDIFSRIKLIQQQTKALASLRDTLLPRLISGQLRLPEAEAMLEEVAA